MQLMLVTLSQWIQTIKGPLLSLMTSLEITAVTTVWESGGGMTGYDGWSLGWGAISLPIRHAFLSTALWKNRYWGLQYIDTGHNNFLLLPTEVDIIGKIMKTTDSLTGRRKNERVFIFLFLPYLLLLQGRMSSLKYRHLVTDWVWLATVLALASGFICIWTHSVRHSRG